MIKLFVEGGFAMYPLLLLSIIAVAITIERFVYLRKARTDTGKFMETINGCLSRNALEEAYQHCDSTTGPIAEIIRAGLKNQKRGEGRGLLPRGGRRHSRKLPLRPCRKPMCATGARWDATNRARAAQASSTSTVTANCPDGRNRCHSSAPRGTRGIELTGSHAR